jgi:hypothetical protein
MTPEIQVVRSFMIGLVQIAAIAAFSVACLAAIVAIYMPLVELIVWPFVTAWGWVRRSTRNG